MRHYIVDEELRLTLINYLSERPFREVHDMIARLSMAAPAEIAAREPETKGARK